MTDRNRPQLLVVGFSIVQQDKNGLWHTKKTIADYLHGLAQSFERCCWLASEYRGALPLEGRIEPRLVTVLPVTNAVGSWRKALTNTTPSTYTLIHLPGGVKLLPVMPLLRRLSPQMVVYLGNDYFSRGNLESNIGSGLRRLLFRMGHEYPLKHADTVLVRGRYLAGKVRALNANVVETIPIGHALGPFQPRKMTATLERGCILYVGKLVEAKGVGDLILALRQFSDLHVDFPVELNIIGDGADRQTFVDQAAELKLTEFVNFLGWIDDTNALRNFYSQADVLVVPSSSEGVPRVITEALSMGLPVVATRVGGIPDEFPPDEVLLVPPGEPAALAHALEQILLDPQVRLRYLTGVEQRAQLLNSFGTAADQHLQILLGGGSNQSIFGKSNP